MHLCVLLNEQHVCFHRRQRKSFVEVLCGLQIKLIQLYAVEYQNLTLWLSISKSTFSQPSYKENCISEVVWIGVIIIFHLSKLWKTKLSILCDVIFLVRLQEKFEIESLFGVKGLRRVLCCALFSTNWWFKGTLLNFKWKIPRSPGGWTEVKYSFEPIYPLQPCWCVQNLYINIVTSIRSWQDLAKTLLGYWQVLSKIFSRSWQVLGQILSRPYKIFQDLG